MKDNKDIKDLTVNFVTYGPVQREVYAKDPLVRFFENLEYDEHYHKNTFVIPEFLTKDEVETLIAHLYKNFLDSLPKKEDKWEFSELEDLFLNGIDAKKLTLPLFGKKRSYKHYKTLKTIAFIHIDLQETLSELGVNSIFSYKIPEDKCMTLYITEDSKYLKNTEYLSNFNSWKDKLDKEKVNAIYEKLKEYKANLTKEETKELTK